MRGTTLVLQLHRCNCLSRAAPALVGRYANTIMGVPSVPTNNCWVQRSKGIFAFKAPIPSHQPEFA